MRYSVVQAETRRQMDDFVRLPRKIYAGCPCYVPDLESDVRDWFDASHNPGLAHCDVAPFVAYDADGMPVGRIAGIVNRKANETWQTRCVRFGWIEFIDDAAVAAALLDAVEAWGKGLGMNTMEGPLGISDFDKEGMLVEDFDRTGSMISIYNHAYYPAHLEQAGFRKQVDWVQVRVDLPQEIPERFARVEKIVAQRFGFKVSKLTKKQIADGGYGRQLFDLLDKAYGQLFGYTRHTDEEVKAFVRQYLPLLDMDMLPVVVDKEGQLIGCAVTMGSLSDALRRSGGRLLPFGWVHLVRSLFLRKEKKVEMMLIAVDPHWQAHGINALLFADLIRVYQRKGYTWAETGPMLESNTKVLSQWEPFSPIIYKRRRCYVRDIPV